jgi:hypothetical protein
VRRYVHIRTIDGLISEIASAYHHTLGLPRDISAWVRIQEDGYTKLAEMVAGLLQAFPMIVGSVVNRYPVVVCDEHQDANPGQHGVIMALHRHGAKVRIFADPMQRIFRSRKKLHRDIEDRCWDEMVAKADIKDDLSIPHRWNSGSVALGKWVLSARTNLASGNPIDLTGALPPGLSIIVADNGLPAYVGFKICRESGVKIRATARSSDSLLILTTQNMTTHRLRAFFWNYPIWEGHTRDALDVLVGAIQSHIGNPVSVANDTLRFMPTSIPPSSNTDPLDYGPDYLNKDGTLKESYPEILKDSPGSEEEKIKALAGLDRLVNEVLDQYIQEKMASHRNHDTKPPTKTSNTRKSKK